MLLTYTVDPFRFVAGGAGEVQAGIRAPYVPKNEPKGFTEQSKDGTNIQTTIDFVERKHVITTTFIDIALMDKWREYEESTIASQVHTFDFAGVPGTPDNPIQVYRLFDKWNVEPVGARFFRVSFTLVEVL